MNALLASSSANTTWGPGLEREGGRAPQVAIGTRAANPADQRRSSTTQPSAQQLSSLNDDQLVAHVRAGESWAFDLLVVRHQRRVRQLATTLMRNEQDAQEIVQDAFLKAYVGIHAFRGESSFYTWLHRIVVNLAIDMKRHPLKHRLDWECIAERSDDTRGLELPRLRNSDPFEATERAEIKRQLTAALSQLNHFHRAVIVMRELEGMSYRDMATALRISKGTVMSRLFHARRRLQGFATECVVP